MNDSLPELIKNVIDYGKYMYVPFNELCIIIFSLYSSHISIYVAVIAYLSFGRHGYMESTIIMYERITSVHQILEKSVNNQYQ